MLKTILFLIVILLVGGCASEPEISGVIQSTLKESTQAEAIPTANMNKRYYEYYLPGEVGKSTSTSLSEIFSKDGYEIVMNFNASAVIIDRFYMPKAKADASEKVKEEASLAILKPSKKQKQTVQKVSDKNGVQVFKGIYKNGNENYYAYRLGVQAMEDDLYLIHLDGTIVDFYSCVPMANIESTLRAMMKVMQSIEFDKKTIVSDFSLKKAEQQQEDNLNYVNGLYAEEGFLADQEYRETHGAE